MAIIVKIIANNYCRMAKKIKLIELESELHAKQYPN